MGSYFLMNTSPIVLSGHFISLLKAYAYATSKILTAKVYKKKGFARERNLKRKNFQKKDGHDCIIIILQAQNFISEKEVT